LSRRREKKKGKRKCIKGKKKDEPGGPRNSSAPAHPHLHLFQRPFQNASQPPTFLEPRTKNKGKGEEERKGVSCVSKKEGTDGGLQMICVRVYLPHARLAVSTIRFKSRWATVKGRKRRKKTQQLKVKEGGGEEKRREGKKRKPEAPNKSLGLRFAKNASRPPPPPRTEN